MVSGTRDLFKMFKIEVEGVLGSSPKGDQILLIVEHRGICPFVRWFVRPGSGSGSWIWLLGAGRLGSESWRVGFRSQQQEYKSKRP